MSAEQAAPEGGPIPTTTLDKVSSVIVPDVVGGDAGGSA